MGEWVAGVEDAGGVFNWKRLDDNRTYCMSLGCEVGLGMGRRSGGVRKVGVRWFLVVLTGYASKGARWWAFAGCRLQVAGVRTLSMYALVDYRSGRSELGQRFEPELQVREPNGTGSNRFKDGSHGH